MSDCVRSIGVQDTKSTSTTSSSSSYPEFVVMNLNEFQYTSAPPTAMSEYYQAVMESQEDYDSELSTPPSCRADPQYAEFGMSFEDQYGGLDELLEDSGLADLPHDEMVRQFVTIVCGAALRHGE